MAEGGAREAFTTPRLSVEGEVLVREHVLHRAMKCKTLWTTAITFGLMGEVVAMSLWHVAKKGNDAGGP